jgi:small subunit ribosomal protein S8
LNTGKIKVYLKYFNKNPTFNNISLISKPSRKIFYSVSNLFKKNTQTGTFIISTSQGLFSSRDAVKKNLGGEVVCYIT